MPPPRGFTVGDLSRTPNALAPDYLAFRVGERLLLTGHSHQAWPDVAVDGVMEAWLDAAEMVDEKWEQAEAQAQAVREGFARLLGDRDGLQVLGQNTHELILRFLSALPLDRRPRLVTTNGEFHTLRRQLDRIAETGRIEVARVAAHPVNTLAQRLAVAVDDRTAAVLASSVLFATGHIVPGLAATLAACRRHGAELLVDAYHQLNVVPCDLAVDGLGQAFVVGGGYKYCQLGEGNAVLRVPPGREAMRPVVTGWFSEFADMAGTPGGEVPYRDGVSRWAGATYDPTSHYRAARVFAFHAGRGLTPEFLRAVSRHQVGRLAEGFDRLDVDPRRVDRDRAMPLEGLAGFLALRAPRAGELCAALRVRGVWADHRGDLLRLGPAPYLSDAQLDAVIAALGEAIAELG